MGIVQGRVESRAKVLLAVGSTSGTTPEKVRHETGGRGCFPFLILDRFMGHLLATDPSI
jgi:hypothetical protein